MHYIGMDCYISTLEFAVVNEAGRLVDNEVADIYTDQTQSFHGVAFLSHILPG